MTTGERRLLGLLSLLVIVTVASARFLSPSLYAGITRLRFDNPVLPGSLHHPAPVEGDSFRRMMLCKSPDIAARVFRRLSETEKRTLFDDEADRRLDAFGASYWIVARLRVIRLPNPGDIRLEFRCPDRAMAVRVTELLSEEIVRASEEESAGPGCDSVLDRLDIQLLQMKDDLVALKAKAAELIRRIEGCDPSASPGERDALLRDIAIREVNFVKMTEIRDMKREARLAYERERTGIAHIVEHARGA